ncbi:50S ribosomal protein L24 [Candidatus Woesearchaeota archaeon CG10_big_fil_rev_8_21_14_0_10_32_9]|nr:MAG: 50S ribosomal protein L24 [Candidatus Woesearchaeota archaeon CG10_big_fil_rev_8_21_14_0_10_32_9]
MKTKFSKTWISSIQPRKQRKYIHNATLDIKSSFLSVNLSKELRKKHGAKNVRIRVGDKVKIMRGSFKSKTGNVEKVDLKHSKVYVTKIETTKRDGSKAKVSLTPSNLQIIELNLTDKKRKAKLTPKENKKSEDN